MNKSKKLILDENRITQIIRRIAFQIYENNMEAKKLTLVGICDQGFELAGKLADELNKIDSKLGVELLRVDMNKQDPTGTIRLNVDTKQLTGKSVVLVDDVLNTGKTMTYGLFSLLETDVLKIEIAVLVDRGHRQFPVSATFSGYQLSTTLEEHIEVKLGKKPAVYLY